MTHSAAVVLQQLLINLGVLADPSTTPTTTAADWSCFSTNEPDRPENCVTIYDTLGRDFGRTMPDGEALNHPGISIRVRSADHDSGQAKAHTIREALSKTIYQNTVHIGSNDYVVWDVNSISQVLPIGKNVPHSKRSIFTINARMAVYQTK